MDQLISAYALIGSMPMSTTPSSSPSKKRRVYPKEFKLSAVRLADQVGAAQAAKDLGVEAGMIRNWRLAARAEGADAFRGQGNRTALEAELEQLRRENRTLRLERDILKKATAFFARAQS
jgi:transposase